MGFTRFMYESVFGWEYFGTAEREEAERLKKIYEEYEERPIMTSAAEKEQQEAAESEDSNEEKDLSVVAVAWPPSRSVKNNVFVRKGVWEDSVRDHKKYLFSRPQTPSCDVRKRVNLH